MMYILLALSALFCLFVFTFVTTVNYLLGILLYKIQMEIIKVLPRIFL